MANEAEYFAGSPLPFVPGEVGNGEFVPRHSTPTDRAIAARTLAEAETIADRTGIDRRRFLHSAGGMAAMLGVINVVACSESRTSGSAASTRGSTTNHSSTTTPTAPAGSTPPSATPSGSPVTTGPGGTFVVPPATDAEACAVALGGDEFIFDMHTHHVMPEGSWRKTAPGMVDMIKGLVPRGCLAADQFECLNRAAYLHDMFLASDTAVALLSDVPNSSPDNAPLPFNDAVGTAGLARSLTHPGGSRVLVHNVIAPNFGSLATRLDDMSARVAGGQVAAFKIYTAWGPQRHGFALDDPAIGLPVLEQARSLGVRVICAHKGLPLMGFDRDHNGPGDLVRVAAMYPDLQFVVYHSAFERETTEGPYDAGRAARGINSLILAMQSTGVAPNTNVWAELGTTWREVMSKPTQAAHVIGKLLRYVGEDRVLWGTDAIWYGTPQPQIMAMRAFSITPEFQDRFGYPELTEARKRKIFGLNAARLFGLDPVALRCGLATDPLSLGKAEQQALVTARVLPSGWSARGPITRRDTLRWLASARAPWTP